MNIEKSQKVTKNITYQRNHDKIISYIKKFIDEQKEYTDGYQLPNVTQIAKATGLDRVTVARHLQELKEYDKEVLTQYKIYLPQIMNNLLNIALNSNNELAKIKASKVLLSFLIKPEPNQTINGETNYIQINNEVKKLEAKD